MFEQKDLKMGTEWSFFSVIRNWSMVFFWYFAWSYNNIKVLTCFLARNHLIKSLSWNYIFTWFNFVELFKRSSHQWDWLCPTKNQIFSVRISFSENTCQLISLVHASEIINKNIVNVWWMFHVKLYCIGFQE